MTLESIAPMSDDDLVKLPALAARPYRPHTPDAARSATLLHHRPGHDLLRAAVNRYDGAQSTNTRRSFAMNPLARYMHSRVLPCCVFAVMAAIFFGLAIPDWNNAFPVPEVALESVSVKNGKPVNKSTRFGDPKETQPSVSNRAHEDFENRANETEFPIARNGSEFGIYDFPATAVPRRIAVTIPARIHTVESIAERKRVFITSMLPLILHVNESIAAVRRDLLELRERLDTDVVELTPRDRFWLARIRARYRVEDNDLDSLLRHVDVVPPSLALAQAAEESGWGTSRYAREGNAVFGQYSYRKGSGLVPRRRDDGERHEVRAFAALLDSVAAYMLNLNSHRAYREFRAERAKLRAQRKSLNGMLLAETLWRYSARGDKYVDSLQSIIRNNQLMRFDRSRLVDAGTVTAHETPPL